jgi:hypothetical protein
VKLFLWAETMKKTYYEKLKDPRWQKKRLEVMQANDFCCEGCGDGESTLNVHHKEYFKNKEPWEYETKQLACLCENCHEFQHENIDLLKWVCSYANLDGPYNRTELAFILGGYSQIPFEAMIKISGLSKHHAYEQAHRAGNNANKVFDKYLDAAWNKDRKNNG